MEVLKNKSYTDSDQLSRYTPFPYYYHTKDNKYVRGITSYLKDTTVYSLYEVQRGDTFDSIALEYYNNPTLYWIICSFNHIQDPFKKPIEGTYIKIPTISTISYDWSL